MSAVPVRVGFAGAGHIAGVHAGILARDRRVRVSAAFDPDVGRLAAFAETTGAETTASFDDLLTSVDAVYICTPNALHAEMARRALDAGLHVFSEKPMATSLADARAVADAARRGRGLYQLGFNRRYASVYKELKRLLDSGELTAFSALLKMNRGELRSPAWTGDPAISGGFLYETPIHMLDLARHLFGEPVDVVCRGRAAVYDQADDFSMLLSFTSGTTAALVTNAHATWHPPFERVEVYGDHATAVTEEMERITIVGGLGQAPRVVDASGEPFEERWGYVEEDGAFVDAIRGEGPVSVGVEEGLRTTELVARCHDAVKEEGWPADDVT
jgi:myo-inositol 2-dehydrogenase/D-chiro-inositol 1-dehydrogenase